MQIWNGKGGQGTLAEVSIGDVERVLDPTSAIFTEDAGEVGDFLVGGSRGGVGIFPNVKPKSAGVAPARRVTFLDGQAR